MRCKAKVAILMATYNGEKYLKEQIESILKQDFKNWELFIHDDCSEDKTLGIIKKYCQKYPEKIRNIEGNSTGCAKNNFFFLMNSIDADYIMFSDQDDYWHSDKIVKTFNEMKRLQEKRGPNIPLLVYTDLDVVDSERHEISASMSHYQGFNIHKRKITDFLAENTVTGCTIMINEPLLNKCKNLKDTSNVIMHDWWLALVAAKYGDISFLNESLIDYRQHGNNSVGTTKYNYEYIFRRLKKGRSIRKRINSTRKQAMCMVRSFDIEDINDVVYRYATIGSQTKIRRLFFYINNGIRKSGIRRTIGLYVFG